MKTTLKTFLMVVVMMTVSGCAEPVHPPRPPVTTVRPPATMVTQRPFATNPTPVTQSDMTKIPVREIKPATPPILTPSVPAPIPPVQAPTPPAPVVAVVIPVEPPKPKAEPSLAEAAAGKEFVSPFTMLSPVLGRWVWANDPKFVMTFHPDGTLEYGTAHGKFQLLNETTITLQLLVNNGRPIQASPEQWTTQFFENRTVLLILNPRQQAMLFKRPPPMQP